LSDSPVLNVQPLGFPWKTLDPFLFCAYHNDAYPAGNGQMGPAASLAGRALGQDFGRKDGWSMYHGMTVPGFPAHPHRGFETVTIVRQGLIDHSDSLGATARFGGGDVQWLTAGKGIVHCEMFPLVHGDQPNPTELFQIWLNLPAKNKMVEPHFTMFWNENVARERLVDAQGRTAEVVCVAGAIGSARGLPPPPDSWASSPDSDLAIWTIQLSAGARCTLPPALSHGTRRQLYFFKGTQLQVGGEAVPPQSAIEVRASQALELVNGSDATELLMLQGVPIGEPVAQYGPFVMNTQAEIQQAIADYRRTEFGGWPWGKSDPVHPCDKERFARHVDGRVEER
jgi:redox-sensitive bicupin YhaK (pirin superfamily)